MSGDVKFEEALEPVEGAGEEYAPSVLWPAVLRVCRYLEALPDGVEDLFHSVGSTTLSIPDLAVLVDALWDQASEDCEHRTLIAGYDHDCPWPDHREWAVKQSGPKPEASA